MQFTYGTIGAGVWTYHSYRSSIEDNIFSYASSTPGLAANYGLVTRGFQWNISNCGLVKGNIFTDVDFGTQVELNNPYLKLSCNDYTTQDFEWLINPEHHGYFLGPQGTGCDEAVDTRADNLFHDAGDHIWSYSQYWKYWAPDVTNGTPSFATPTINGSGETCMDVDNRSCESGGGNIGDEKYLKADLDDAIEVLKNEYDDAEFDLDNGQKSTMLTNIENSGYSNATLTADLLNNSLLSDEVLIAACNRSPFFSYNQFVSIVNHNSPVSWDVWQEIEQVYYESEAPPDTIVDAQNTDSLRTLTTIKREMDRLKTDLFLTEFNIISFYADADSMPDLVNYLVDSLGEKDYRKLAVGVCLQYDSVEWAREILDDIILEDENDTAFYEYNDVAVSLAEDDLTWFGMDGTQKAKVAELSLSDYEVAVHAQAVLRLVDDSVYVRLPEVMEGGSGKWDEEEEPVVEEEENMLKNISIYPNPFTNNFNVNYVLEQEAINFSIEVYDLLGRSILTRKIQKTASGTINIDLGECLGIYVLYIYADDKQVHKEKLICLQK